MTTPNPDLGLYVLWIRVDATTTPLFVGVFYHNPPIYNYQASELLYFLKKPIDRHLYSCPIADVIIGGDFSSLRITEVTQRTGLIRLVKVPTKGTNILSMLMGSADTSYQLKVIASAVRSDHKAILATVGTPQAPNYT